MYCKMSVKLLSTLFFYFPLVVTNCVLADDVIITLPNGDILGREDISYDGRSFYNFQKIPYAAPPVDDLRFKAPIPPNNWDGVLNTTQLDVMCYQWTFVTTIQSEDCLYLNIYTPELPNEDNSVARAVLLYIHGGGFNQGHAMQSALGPEFLIDYDVVVVTLNYRLGIFGFLSTEDTVIPGNAGLKDQELAIQWLNTNIHLFGGDPDKITIVGESAGAGSVGYQLLHKNSEGLFRAAVMESGAAINVWALQRDARTTAFSLASLLNDTFMNINDTEVLLEYLQTVPAETLMEASAVFSWKPVIESKHEGAFITEKMYGLINSGNFVQVPVLMGINSEEAGALDVNTIRGAAELYDSNPETLVPDSMGIFLNNDSKKTFGRNIMEIYCGNESCTDHLGAVIRFNSDTLFNRASIRCAEMKSQFVDVFFYQFSYDGMMGNITINPEAADHVSHIEELRYIWHSTEIWYDNSDLSHFPEADVLTHHRMLTIWTNFVKYLNPTPEEDDLLQNVTWPTVSSGEKGDFLYLDIGENLEVKNHPKEETYLRWLELYAMLGTDDFDTF